jgi:hypothetical protein
MTSQLLIFSTFAANDIHEEPVADSHSGCFDIYVQCQYMGFMVLTLLSPLTVPWIGTK